MVLPFVVGLDVRRFDEPDRGIAVLSGSFAAKSSCTQGFDGVHGRWTAFAYVDEQVAFCQHASADLFLQVCHGFAFRVSSRCRG